MPVSQPPWLLADDGSTGIMLAHSMMKPRFFSYTMHCSKEKEATLSWRVPLGLSPATAKFPGRAELEFLLGSFDGRYSARGGMQTYYDAFPEIYRSRLQDRGAWALWIPGETLNTAKKCGMLLNQREWDLGLPQQSRTGGEAVEGYAGRRPEGPAVFRTVGHLYAVPPKLVESEFHRPGSVQLPDGGGYRKDEGPVQGRMPETAHRRTASPAR